MPVDMGGAAAVLALSFAIQQLVEYVDVFAFRTKKQQESSYRLPVLKAVALVAGVAAAWTCSACKPEIDGLGDFLVRVVVALALAGGTEGANSLLKFARYAKDRKREEAEMVRTRRFILHGETLPPE